MKLPEQKRALNLATHAARAAGRLMRANQFETKQVDAASQHDIKLALDARAQNEIEEMLADAYPDIPLLGEEGVHGDPAAAIRWVVDPIDGTVNFTYGIPHACVSIALQQKAENPGEADYEDGYQTLVGVVYDPFCGEMWTAVRGEPTRLNGKEVRVSNRKKMNEAIVSIGFAKSRENLEAMLPYFNELVHRVRKIRMMGAAALALAYVATGRFDAYIERGIRLWDIAAGGLILECAGGRFEHKAVPGEHAYKMIASNGVLHRGLRAPL